MSHVEEAATPALYDDAARSREGSSQRRTNCKLYDPLRSGQALRFGALLLVGPVHTQLWRRWGRGVEVDRVKG